MHVRLNGIEGSVLKQNFEFNESVVTVGREPSCQLRLDEAREPRVSGRHCEIFEQDGKHYVRDLDSLNGTMVDGARITQPTVLRSGSRLQLGDKGAVFVVEFERSAGVQNTMANTLQAAGNPAARASAHSPAPAAVPAKQGIGVMTLEREIGKAVGQVRKEQQTQKKSYLAVTAAVLVLALGAALFVWKSGQEKLQVAKTDIETRLTQDRDATQKKISELTNRVAASERDLRDQLASIGAEINSRGAEIAALQLQIDKDAAVSADDRAKLQKQIAERKDELQQLEKSLDTVQSKNQEMYNKAMAPFKDVAKQSENSIYSVFFRKNGNFSFVATAFAINPTRGLLGTNSHVTEGVRALLASGTTGNVVVRCNSDPRFTYTVKRAIVHPDYGGSANIHSVDVGILEVDLFVDGQTLSMPGYLHPASPEELDALASGDPMALFGYPGVYKVEYERKDGQTNVAKLTTGIISGTRSFAGIPLKGREFDRIEHTCNSMPGNSGSPVFNSAGKVVGLHYSGMVMQVAGPQASLPVGGVSYAVNVRFLKQLVELNYGPNSWN